MQGTTPLSSSPQVCANSYQQVNVQKKSLKNNLLDSKKLLQAHEKCAMKMKESRKQRKNDACVQMFLMEGSMHFLI